MQSVAGTNRSAEPIPLTSDVSIAVDNNLLEDEDLGDDLFRDKGIVTDLEAGLFQAFAEDEEPHNAQPAVEEVATQEPTMKPLVNSQSAASAPDATAPADASAFEKPKGKARDKPPVPERPNFTMPEQGKSCP